MAFLVYLSYKNQNLHIQFQLLLLGVVVVVVAELRQVMHRQVVAQVGFCKHQPHCLLELYTQ
jgi:type II secretory pathway component PulK